MNGESKPWERRAMRHTHRADSVPVQFRMDKELHAKLTAEAQRNFRALNGEITYRLLASFDDRLAKIEMRLTNLETRP